MPLEISGHLPSLYPPSVDTIIARYIDLPKFLSLISTSTLFLTRLDLMEDKLEGRVMKKSAKELENWFANQFSKQKKVSASSEDNFSEAAKMVDTMKHFIENTWRNTLLISCWSLYEAENYALWKIFAKTDTGIMIKSKVINLYESLKEESKKLWISKIKYYSEGDGVDDIGNIIQYAVYKNVSYRYENEVRILYAFSTDVDIHKFNWGEQENQVGVSVKIDLNKLIDEIVLGPDCQKWFEDIVRSVCEKYGINKPIRISDLRYRE